MNAQEMHSLLGRLTGHLVSETPQTEADLQQLHRSLARTLLPDDLKQLKATNFSFENSDLFSLERVPASRMAALQSIAERSASPEVRPELRAFAREVPVRSPLAHASSPSWAAGAAVDHTVGPFLNADGRQFWFDFFLIERLVALYFQNSANPALLFNVRTRIIFTQYNLPPITDALPVYHLPPGSIWIYSQFLAPNAPPDVYTGLTIKGGTITLSAPPQLINGKLTLAPNTTVHVQLQLQQPAVQGDPSSPYGTDARAASLKLPAELNFHFSASGTAIDLASDTSWTVYGQKNSFRWNKNGQSTYNAAFQRVLIPYDPSPTTFEVSDCKSPFATFQGEAKITGSAWALPVAAIDVLHPTPAAGIGGILAICGPGLSTTWTGLKGGLLSLKMPGVLAEPGAITVFDLKAGNVFCQQTFDLWKDAVNPFGTTLNVQFPTSTFFFFQSMAAGSEAIMALVNADAQVDRPVTVTGQPAAVRSKNSVLILAASKTFRLIYLFDDNILADVTDLNQVPPIVPQPISLALENALFKVTPVNGCLLFGSLAEDFIKVERGFLYLSFGLMAYLPTLPDPYAANIEALKYQFRGQRGELAANTRLAGGSVWMWLVCQVAWQPGPEAEDEVKVSFFFAPRLNQFQALTATPAPADSARAEQFNLCAYLLSPPPAGFHDQVAAPDEAAAEIAPASPEITRMFADITTPIADTSTEAAAGDTSPQMLSESMASLDYPGLPDYQAQWNQETQCLQQDLFSLLDVSTNADLLGVSFNSNFGSTRLGMVRTFGVTGAFPLQVQGMDVVSSGNNVRAFTVPEISWEPVINTGPHALPGDPPGGPVGGPPELVPNFYPDDGGPTRIYNNSAKLVPLAPLPLSKFLLDEFKKSKYNVTSSLFTLPFGMRALAVLDKFVYPAHPPSIQFNQPSFDNKLKGGLQLQFDAGVLPSDPDYPMFNGATAQMNNVLDLLGNSTGASTLGQSVTIIFNDEFKLKPNPLTSRGVPLTRVDFSGYGAEIFSNWFNPLAQMAQTSQVKFDVWRGRTAHEVVQVKSIIYPWGIRVVRTIILYRASTGYEFRVDTGWKAESDGKFDFSYYVRDPNDTSKLLGKFPDYEVHPGVIEGLFNVKNIVEVNNQFPTKSIIHHNEYYLDDNNFTYQNTGGDKSVDALLQMVTFDADVEIEGVVQGQVNGRVPSKGVVGFVQLAPRGIPISKEAFRALLNYQPTPIGGPVDCIIDVGGNGQQMRLSRFDVNNSLAANGVDPIFAAAARGSVLLPKEGAWSMVRHQRGTGQVTPLPDTLPIPLVRIGALTYQVAQVDANNQVVTLKPPNVTQALLRIANPLDLLRAPNNTTLNFGFLHSTDTQKALFLTPAYKLLTNPNEAGKLLSKTPPLFVDAFRIVNSKGIFPNVGDAESTIGDAINLFSNGTEFAQNALTDGGKQVLELMQINQTVNNTVQQGYKLLKKVTDFSLPNTSFTLIEVGGSFKIYIEYEASNLKKPDGGIKNVAGSLNFDVDSFTKNLEDRWKSIMSDVALVVDLGPIKRLMTIKGNWNAQNGNETQYAGNANDPDFPTPQIEFAPELKPVIEILQILQDMQTSNYKDAFQKGLKLAMSNQENSWQYKLEASKEIPVVRFPTPDFLYNDPNAPLKLEAGLKLGAYFNAALKVTTDPKQLLPTAGGYLGFYGRLSVMCVSLSAATIYAVGQVNLDIGADTKLGPTLHMKFGFGAQIVVGLPVVGNVSVLYVVGVEIYIDISVLKVSAFMLFQGHAELLGGIVGVTITIEAKGTVSRANERTDLAAQVTFGLDISIFLVIDISFSTSWEEQRQIA